MPDYAPRRAALRAALGTAELPALLVTDLVGIRYLTGFTGSNAALLVVADDEYDAEQRTVIATDGRYRTQVSAQVPDLAAVIERAVGPALATRAGELGVGRLGFEAEAITVAGYGRLTAVVPDLALVPTTGMIARLREVKDPYEVDRLRAACAIADAALADLLERGSLRPGRSERAVARELEWAMFDRGAHAVAFETIVAAGANSAVPHHRPTDQELVAGDFLKLDFGAVVDGYHSDMTRTFVLRKAADWQREVYQLVAAAQAAGRAALVPGADLREVDAAARAVIDAAGHGELFPHGLGHGVGLEIHEAPGIGLAGTGTLLDGAAVTVEPGVYFSGRGGVRIEDTLVVRAAGPELLTSTSKELTIV
ncbi:Xaa-Pro peptidase family protein [Skermania piniformis]|uniref:Xaa-Pro peptidase family protein n=1 Tax=Skermania pinensis TaxID=39122 RepID=A0ABX8SD52_9ACTN|nr:Xaa-Pro peptidase family protein [Skermania piniformis]QXQ15804.1 Xaa-Pro peptidase family protein [Skermania piniformis]